MKYNFLGVKLWSLLIAAGLIISLATRLSYSNNMEKFIEERFSCTVGSSSGLIDENEVKLIKNLNELQNESDVIVKIKATGQCEFLKQTVLTAVEVIKVYKGNLSEGKVIRVFEPSSFEFSHSAYEVKEGYNLLNSETEYILFLKKRDYPKGYKLKSKDIDSYIFTSNTFGKFSVNNKYQQEIFDGTKADYIYRDIKNLDIIIQNSSILSRYNELKKDILKAY